MRGAVRAHASLFDSHSASAGTVTGRIEGIKSDIHVALRRPFFGHGLGTSAEANANFGDTDHRAHNLYTEVAQELGFVGLIIFVLLLRATVVNFLEYMRDRDSSTSSKREFLWALGAAGEVWLAMNLLFSLASYGLHSYEWYLVAGLSVVLKRLSATVAVENTARRPRALVRVAS